MSILDSDRDRIQRIRRVARRDFRYIYGPTNRIPRGRLLDEFSRTFGSPQFDGLKWHNYSVLRVNVRPLEDQRLLKIAQKHRVSQSLVREIRRELSK